MDMGLRNRGVLVTGSSAGIGRATAIAFGREGARVGITYRQRRDQAEETAKRVVEEGGLALLAPYDLSREESISKAVQALEQHWGTIQVLVNNAVQWETPEHMRERFEDISRERWGTMLGTALTGVFLTIQKVVPGMRAEGWGRIVNLSTNVAEDGLPGAGPYASAKAGLHGLARVLAKELGPVGVLTNVVLPGFTATERNLQLMPQQMRDMVVSQTPTGRLTTPEDVAALVTFLGSAANGHVNGEMIRCNGGL